jgi:hypothetical protein
MNGAQCTWTIPLNNVNDGLEQRQRAIAQFHITCFNDDDSVEMTWKYSMERSPRGLKRGIYDGRVVKPSGMVEVTFFQRCDG